MKGKLQILVCDYVGNSQQWLENFTIPKNYEVVGTITPQSDKKLLLENSWDYLLIFEQDARQFFDSMVKFMNIAAERVIYALEILSWTTHPTAAYSIVNPNGYGGGGIHRALTFETSRKLNYYITCTTADGFNYIATSMDIAIMKFMYNSKKTWSEDDMKIFYDLTKKFYQIDDSNGLFLDLGANIGTTGIYFIKKFTPNLKLLAFEPDVENFKLLRANLILNDLYEETTAENFGLGVEESQQIMYRNISIPGQNGLFQNSEDAPTETIKIISLDKYFSDKNLKAEDIKYIWIDTEGFEPQVLLGAQNILRKNPAPIFMEFNPHLWQKSGFYEKMMALLTEIYESYIWKRSFKTSEVYPIEELWKFQNETASLGGDIFLIKKS